MHSIQVERKQARRNALRPLGIAPDRVRVFTSQVEAQQLDAAILALPFWNGSGEEPMQALQTAAGVPGFMVGLSAVSGDDPVL